MTLKLSGSPEKVAMSIDKMQVGLWHIASFST
jgi:hypothetical protein